LVFTAKGNGVAHLATPFSSASSAGFEPVLPSWQAVSFREKLFPLDGIKIDFTALAEVPLDRSAAKE
jgi:hypothetical protein